MLGYAGRAGVVAAMLVSCGAAHADETANLAPVKQNGLLAETTLRARGGCTELAYRGPRPKAWDCSLSPELRGSLRLIDGWFEGKIELGVTADRFNELSAIDTNSTRIDMQAGVNTGSWSYLLEWKVRDAYQPDFSDFLVELDTYDLRVRKRFRANLFDGLPPSICQASMAGGTVAAIPHLFARDFAEFELEMLQPIGHGFTIMIAPKLEFSEYDDFPGGEREDAALSLRLIPAYNFGDGVSLSVEGQATVAFSTLETKTGETWALTPILRLQKAW